jgi:single-strand DNA-binding protein
VRKGAKDETIWWRVSVWGEQFDKMIPYFKKGSPIVVVGEMNKPEIFTDRDGRPQVSMSLTAFNILFSPFGRPDSSGGEGHHEEGHREPAHAGMGAGAGGDSAFGQGKGHSPSFAEDEVPF